MPFVAMPSELSQPWFHRRRTTDEPFAPGVTESRTDPLIGWEWPLEQRHLPFLVSVDFEREHTPALRDILPFPLERLGLVNGQTALYRMVQADVEAIKGMPEERTFTRIEVPNKKDE